MQYLRTRTGTEWEIDEPTLAVRIMQKALFFVPSANPGYDGKLQLVQEWLIEFESDGVPGREIGIGADGIPVLAGPDRENYGFWLDTNMTLDDFEGTEVSKDVFESLWKRARGE